MCICVAMFIVLIVVGAFICFMLVVLCYRFNQIQLAYAYAYGYTYIHMMVSCVVVNVQCVVLYVL